MTRATRRRGLLGRDGLDGRLRADDRAVRRRCTPRSCASPSTSCSSIVQGYAVKIVRDLVPWRIAGAPRAHAVVEMAAGSLAQVDLAVGDRLFLSTDASCVPEADQVARRRAMAAAAL